MILPEDNIGQSGEDGTVSKLSDELTAVDLHLDDDIPETTVPTKLTFSVSPEESALPSSHAHDLSNIEIVINQYERKGEGINAFIVYKIVSKINNVLGYANREYEVWRRFSDFLGLHEKLMEKHFHKGTLVPAAPEKSIAALTKTKMNSSPDDPITNEFAERRARLLQRFCVRISRHPKLVSDCEFRDFITLAVPLPRASSTVALSGAGVKRIIKSVGDVFSKMAYHMDENDRWFEMAQQKIEDTEQALNVLLRVVESICAFRRELSSGTDTFSKALSMLASCEENTALARALSHLTETYESIAVLHSGQADRDCSLFSEAIYEQTQLVVTVRELFYERVKLWQNWQAAQQNLSKKREMKARYELASRTDKVNQIKDELSNVEKQVDDMERDFAEISKSIRSEYERYMTERKVDLKKMLVDELEGLVEAQKELLKQWEKFAPETMNILIY